jgi:hypothetical protein
MKHNNDVHISHRRPHTENHRNEISKDHHDELLALKELLAEMEAQTWHVHEHLRMLLDSCSREEMLALLNELELTDKNLKFIEIMALEKSDHDIHGAIREIKKLRKLNSPDDPVDHMNYTAI